MEQVNRPVKFLILRFSSIGDIVLTTPVVRRLKQQLPNAKVCYLTKPVFAGMLKANPYIDKVYTLDTSIKNTAKKLKYEHFDYIIDLHHNARTMRLKNRMKVLSFSFRKLNYEKWLLVNFKKNRMPDVHIVDRYMETVNLFDIENDNKGLDYFISPETPSIDTLLPKRHQNGYVALVLGANHATKQLPDNKIQEICQHLSYPIVLLGGKDVQEKGKSIATQFSDNVISTCGDISLDASARLIEKAQVVITPDTGLMHIAAAFRRKIVSIWGNTVPEFGMTPYRAHPESIIIENKNLKCRPCSKIGFSKCPKKHFKCIQDLSVTKICTQVDRLWDLPE